MGLVASVGLKDLGARTLKDPKEPQSCEVTQQQATYPL